MTSLLRITTQTTLSFAVLVVTIFFLAPSITLAQSLPAITIEPVTPITDAQGAIDTIIPFILGAGAFACFAYIIYGGYKYITAGDKAENTAAARQTIINACIGLVLLALSYVIWLFVLNITGIGNANDMVPPSMEDCQRGGNC